MKGLVCTIEKDIYNERKYFEGKQSFTVVCVSDVHSYGVCIAHESGEIETVNPERLTIITSNAIPLKLDDWRIQMGFGIG